MLTLRRGSCEIIPINDTGRTYRAFEQEISDAVSGILRSGWWLNGPQTEAFATAFAGYLGVPFCQPVANGTDALELAFRALKMTGRARGSEVVTVANAGGYTVTACRQAGFAPVFVDVIAGTQLVDPQSVVAALAQETAIVVATHLYGGVVDVPALRSAMDTAGFSHVPIVEDCAQAHGGRLGAKRAGALGDLAIFSFYPTKNLGGWGDGGMLTTENDQMADKLRLLRVHGMQPRYYHQLLGINSRLDTLQAAVLNVKLPCLEGWTAQRQFLALRYGELLRNAKLDGPLGLPAADAEGRHVWNQYVVRVSGGHRDSLREHLAQRKIGTEIYYPVPLHRQQCFDSLGYHEGSLPETERAARETLALPIFPELTAAEQSLVVEEVAAYFKQHPLANGSALAGPKFLKHGTRANREA